MCMCSKGGLKRLFNFKPDSKNQNTESKQEQKLNNSQLDYVLVLYDWLYSHYVYWDFNSKITSHFQFLQNPFILDVCKSLKKIWKFSRMDFWDIPIYPFWNRMDMDSHGFILWLFFNWDRKNAIFETFSVEK